MYEATLSDHRQVIVSDWSQTSGRAPASSSYATKAVDAPSMPENTYVVHDISG